MGLKTMSLLSGATVSASGGTAMAFIDDGVTIQNGVHLTVPATADARVRESATAKYKPAQVNADGSFTKDRKTISIAIPMVTAAGKIVYNSIRIEREVHPEFSVANCLVLNGLGAQALIDSDVALFWSAGSLS